MKRNTRILIAAAIITFGALSLWCYWPTPRPIKDFLPAKTRNVLENGERFVLISLDPIHPSCREKSDPPPDVTFHEFDVLGEKEIRDPQERSEVLNALYRGIVNHNGLVAACFNPRHGIRATLKDETVDLVICFECAKIHIHDKQDGHVGTASSPQSTLNRILKNAGVPLPNR